METCSTTLLMPETTADNGEPHLLRFRPVRMDDITSLKRYFDRYPTRSCDFSVGGVLMWSDYLNYEISESHGSLFIMGEPTTTGELIFYRPCGPVNLETAIRLMSRYCASRGREGILLVDEEYPASETPVGNYAADWMEYVYEAERFATFAGRKMEKKRNHLNFFIHNYSPFETEEISAANIAEVIAFTIAFKKMREESDLAEYEIGQVLDVLRNYEFYPFFGIALRHAGGIIGYSFGEKVGDTFFVHVEKGDINYRGVYQAISSRMAQAVVARHPEVKFLNREEDMGDESLRLSKESYHPTLLVHKKVVHLPLG